MTSQFIGKIAVVVGLVVGVVSLAANPLGIGSNPGEFGWLQALGAVLGLLTVAAGLWLTQRKP